MFKQHKVSIKNKLTWTLYRGGKQVVTDEAVQPSVDAYNRYIHPPAKQFS